MYGIFTLCSKISFNGAGDFHCGWAVIRHRRFIFLESNPNNSVVVRSLFEMIEECKIYLFSFRFSVASHHWYFNCWKISMIYYYWMMMDIVTNCFARLNFIALIDDWISQVVLISLPWFTLQDIIKSSSQTEKI